MYRGRTFDDEGISYSLRKQTEQKINFVLHMMCLLADFVVYEDVINSA